MKKPLRASCACAAFILSTSLFAQVDHTADHDALRKLRDTVTDAINRQDIPALSACMAKSFTFTTVNQRRTITPEELQAVYNEFFHGPGGFITSYRTSPDTDAPTSFLDDKVGVATGTSKENYVLKGGKNVDMTVRWTATVIKDGEAWKVAALHVGVDPLDNPILTGAVGFWKKMGLAALVVGALAGFLLGKLTKRKA